MPEILVISGKGGTGKTSLTAALVHLAGKSIVCDLDVDAPDLHLLLKPAHRQTHEFWSGHEAQINDQLCSQCGQCIQLCRFDAVIENQNGYAIDPLRCEGCKTCVALCPEQAIDFIPKQCGNWYVSNTRWGTPMVHAQLFPAEENSGRLVALLRQQAKALSKENGLDLIIADGPPGIGCPVISALSGTDMAVLVTEPTPSGLHDLERVAGLCDHFKIPTAVIINKGDLNPDLSNTIRHWCQDRQIPMLAELPHDPDFVHAMVAGKVITEYGNPDIKQAIETAWDQIRTMAAQAKKKTAPEKAG